MRVLFLVTDVFARGGIQRYSRYQARALREQYGEARVSVLSLLAPGADGFEEPFAVEPFASRGGPKLLRNLRYAWRALSLARRHGADIVIANHVKLAPVAMAVQRATGTRFCVNTYGIEVWSGLSFLERRALAAADRIFADAQFTRDYLVSELGLDARKIVVLEDCVDLERFTPGPEPAGLRARLGIDPGRKILLTVARLSSEGRYKGHERIMRALRAHARDLPLCYLIVGDGDDRARLERLARELELGDACRFAGAVSERELVDHYRLCDLAVLVSERGPHMGEGIPLALLEASACGKPIIAGCYDGSAEAVDPGNTGLVVDSLDLPAIAAAVRTLATGDALRARMGAAGRERIERQFGYPRFRERLHRCLMDLWSVRARAARMAPASLERT